MMQGPKPLKEQLGGKCRHFNGIYNDTCEAGISYDSVRDTSTRPYHLPCFKEDGCAERCQHTSYLTDAEVEAKEREISQFVTAFLTELAEGKTCPHCHHPIEGRKQVGRCIYLFPCGCRLGQGSLKEYEQKGA